MGKGRLRVETDAGIIDGAVEAAGGRGRAAPCEPLRRLNDGPQEALAEGGPVMAEASVGAIQMRGFLMIVPIWSILVPRPWLTRPPTPFSL